jgi:hypothetical protein
LSARYFSISPGSRLLPNLCVLRYVLTWIR